MTSHTVRFLLPRLTISHLWLVKSLVDKGADWMTRIYYVAIMP